MSVAVLYLLSDNTKSTIFTALINSTTKQQNMSYNLLKGKKGIIFGALDERSIAWKTAERVHEEGGEFVLTNAPIAMRMGTINQLAEKTGSQIIPADATSVEDLENLVEKSMEILGGKLDFVLHSIGMSINVRKGRHYTDQKYDWTQKGTDVSAMSFHKVMQTNLPHTKPIIYPTSDHDPAIIPAYSNSRISLYFPLKKPLELLSLQIPDALSNTL